VQYGNSSDNYSLGVATDVAGNVFASGYTPNGILGQPAVGGTDAYVAKWDSSGTLQWASVFGTSTTDTARGLALVGTSSVAVGGLTYGSLPGYTSAGSADALARLYDGAGTPLWTLQFGTAAFDETRLVAADGLDHIYVGGYTEGSFAGFTAAGAGDAFVSQLDAVTGAVNWTFQIGSSAYDYSLGLAADSLGNVYLGGRTEGALPGQTAFGGNDAFVLKLDVNGTLQWVSQFGTANYERLRGVAVDSTGSILVTGYTGGALPGQTALGGGDAFLRKLDPDGNTLWTRQFGTTAYDEGLGIAVDADDRIVVGGTTYGTFPGESNPSGADAFIRVFLPDGTAVFTDQFGGTGDVLTDGGVALDTSGHAYLAGYTNGALPGQTNAGSNDAFLIQATIPVPEPTTATLLLGSLTLLGLRRRRG